MHKFSEAGTEMPFVGLFWGGVVIVCALAAIKKGISIRVRCYETNDPDEYLRGFVFFAAGLFALPVVIVLMTIEPKPVWTTEKIECPDGLVRVRKAVEAPFEPSCERRDEYGACMGCVIRVCPGYMWQYVCREPSEGLCTSTGHNGTCLVTYPGFPDERRLDWAIFSAYPSGHHLVFSGRPRDTDEEDWDGDDDDGGEEASSEEAVPDLQDTYPIWTSSSVADPPQPDL